MAAKKGSTSSKTAHVLNLLGSASKIEAEPPAQKEEPPLNPPSAPQVQHEEQETKAEVEGEQEVKQEVKPDNTQSRHLAPPILEVARTNHNAISESIHNALEDALQAELKEQQGLEVPQPRLAEEASQAVEPEIAVAEEASQAVEPAPAVTEEPKEAAAPKPAVAEEANQAEIPQQGMAEGNKETGVSKPTVMDEAEPEHFYDHLEDGSEFVNVMQILVEEKIEKYVKMFKLCQCPRCMSDVEALTLSRLPAQYVVLSSKNKIPLLTVYRSKYDSQVTTQIIYACKEVMQDPRH